MFISPHRFPLLLVLVAGLCLAATQTSVAGDVSFPKKSPLVQFTIPDKWRGEEGTDGGQPVFTCEAGEKGFLIVSSLKETYDADAFEEKLPDIAKAWLNEQTVLKKGLENIQYKGTHSGELRSGIKSVNCDATFSSGGTSYNMSVFGLTVGGKSMLVLCAWPKSEEFDLEKLLNSFKASK